MAEFTSKLLLKGFALSALSAALLACGAATNNLSDPVTDTTTTTCGTSSGLCVTGQLLDDPVGGINYECDDVSNVTTAEGYFECPNNTVVTFSVKSTTGNRKVTLGSTVIKAVVLSVLDSTSGKVKYQPQLVQVTPFNLVDEGDKLESLEGSDIATDRVVNLMRFLQGLGTPAEMIPAPSGMISVSQATRDKLDLLTSDVGAGTFANTDQLNSLMTTIGLVMPSAANAKARFLAGQHTVLGGLYEAVPQVFSITRAEDDVVETGMVGQYGTTTVQKDTNGNVINRIANKAVEALLVLLDREGKSIAVGLEWKGQTQSGASDINIPKSISDLRFKVAPSDVVPVNDSLGFLFSGRVKPGFKFKVVDNDTGLDDGFIEVTQGINQQGYITGHPFVYRTLFGIKESADVPLERLGKWHRLDKNGNQTYTGTLNMERKRRFDPLLDPTGWKTNDSVAVGQTPIFPLHFRMTFRDSNVSTAGGCASTNGCEVGTVGVTVLENGNIISDMNDDCSAVDASLMDGLGQQEYRLGAVSALLNLEGSYFFSPVMLFSQIPGWEKYSGTVVGAAGRKARIDISHIASRQISMLSFEADAADSTKLSAKAAEWLNYTKALRYSQTYPASQDKTANLPKASGVISGIALQACYNPVPKSAP